MDIAQMIGCGRIEIMYPLPTMVKAESVMVMAGL
jgi:hypothetical protein